MSIFGKIFASEKAIDKSIDAVVNGLDKLVYTSEEKAEATAKARTEAQGILIDWLKNSSGQNLARRWLAMAITSTWLGQYLGGMAFALVSVFVRNIEEANRVLAASGILSGYANEMSGAVMLILGFYFAAPYMGTVIDKVFDKVSLKSPGVK